MSAVVYEIEGYKNAENKLYDLCNNGYINKKSLDENLGHLKFFNNEDGANTQFKFIVDKEAQDIDILYAPPLSMVY